MNFGDDNNFLIDSKSKMDLECNKQDKSLAQLSDKMYSNKDWREMPSVKIKI